MKLEGSCHCGGVSFELMSAHPYPFNYCFCSICRKTQGGGGFAINLGGDAASLKINGAENISVYQARLQDEKTGEFHTSPGKRHFCRICGSGLWLFDPRWPELVHPFASAIDTELPSPPEHTYLMMASKKSWVPCQPGPDDKIFDEYPDESIAAWHQRQKLEC
ncbi:MAG: alanine acetyltransferase [Sneathiella sp.]|nr:MAG: alanine acetyltransferase [Sneathiella sp.]